MLDAGRYSANEDSINYKQLVFPVFAAIGLTGQQVFFVIPFIVGGLVSELSASYAEAGLVISVEFGVLAAVCLALSPFMGQLSRRRLAIVGAMLLLSANVATAVALLGATQTVSNMLLIRACAGLGSGLALAAGNATTSMVSRPDQLYSRTMILIATYALICQVALPYSIEAWGINSLFFLLVGVSILAFVFLRNLPGRPGDSVNKARQHVICLPSHLSVFAVLILLSILIFNVRESFAFTYIERIGVTNVGVTSAHVGLILGIGSVVGVFGSILAGLVSKRIGVHWPAIFGAALAGLCTYVIYVTETRSIFDVTVLIWSGCFYFTWVMIAAIAASADKRGRVAAAGGATMLAAYAVGPATAGSIIDHFGFESLATTTLWLTGLSVLGLLLIKRIS